MRISNETITVQLNDSIDYALFSSLRDYIYPITKAIRPLVRKFFLQKTEGQFKREKFTSKIKEFAQLCLS